MSQTSSSDDQVASQDEFDIAMADGIEDDSLREETSIKKFQITSYGADYTVDSLVKRMKNSAFNIPPFQRRFVWSHRHASKFIESLLMGLPVPGIFLYKEENNKHLVIDGQQRLKTLEAFYRGVFEGKEFKLIGVNDSWAGKTYDTLEIDDRLKLDDSIVHSTIFRQDVPADVLDSIYFVFERINSGGIRLSPQEIRNCISAGPFTEMVQSLNREKPWREIFGGSENKRAKDQELIVRFFAMLNDRHNYKRPMAKFLTDYSTAQNRKSPKELEEMARLFRDNVKLLHDSVGPKLFRPVRSLNAAVFDAVMVGMAERMKSSPPQFPALIEAAYTGLLNDPEFRSAWIRATADEESVSLRLYLAVQAFAAIN